MAGLIDTGISYRKQANAAFAQQAKGATERANFNRKMKAADKAGKFNAAGQGLGMGYTAYESGLLGKGAEKLGLPDNIVNILTPSNPAAEGLNTVQNEMLAQPVSAPVTPGTPTTGDAMFSGELPSGNLSGAANEIANATNTVANATNTTANAANTTANAANTVNAANTTGNAATTAGQAAEAASGSSTAGGLGTIGGAIEGATAGMAAGGVAGGIGGGIGGAIGGTVASPLALAGSLANLVGATGVGSTLTGAASLVSGAAANAGASSMAWLAALLL